MLPMSVRDNLSFAALGKFSRWGIVDRAAEREAIDRIMHLLGVRSDGIEPAAGSLSGGNQQKLVIGKWLLTAPRIILLNDPTRGIDVGTKQEIYSCCAAWPTRAPRSCSTRPTTTSSSAAATAYS
jgi:ribose transport system ATP-binding protein